MRFGITIGAAPFVAVLLVVAAVYASIGHVPVGLPRRVGEVEPCYPGDRRVVVIGVLADGTIKINVDPVTPTELGERLDGIFRTRAVRLAYITADADVPFGRVAAVIDTATIHLDHVALLPRSRVLARKPFPGETDVCVAMRFTERESNSSDRRLGIWR